MSEDRHTEERGGERDELHRFISLDGSFRVVSLLNTGLVQEAIRRHGLSGLAAVALGRALTSAQLLATLAKGKERVTLQIQGDGPLRGLVADAWSSGEARGYVNEAVVLHPAPGQGRAQVSRVLGRQGTVNVFRDLGLKDVYQGTGRLTMGEVDEDVESYLRVSEQIPTALGCEVLLDGLGQVAVSAGVMVQAMPGTKEEEGDPVREAQHRLRTGSLRRALEGGNRDAGFLAAELVLDKPLRNLSVTPLRFFCPCNKERVAGALATLGPDELEQLMSREGRAEVTCHFCNEVYQLDFNELRSLVDGLKASLN